MAPLAKRLQRMVAPREAWPPPRLSHVWWVFGARALVHGGWTSRGAAADLWELELAPDNLKAAARPQLRPPTGKARDRSGLLWQLLFPGIARDLVDGADDSDEDDDDDGGGGGGDDGGEEGEDDDDDGGEEGEDDDDDAFDSGYNNEVVDEDEDDEVWEDASDDEDEAIGDS
jgi:hypothetical protein